MNYQYSNRPEGWIQQYIGLENHEKGKYWKRPYNIITGCTPVSEGCKNCWAEEMNDRFNQGDFNELKFHGDKINEPYKWKDSSLVFVNNTSDIFHDKISFGTTQRIWKRILGTSSRDTLSPFHYYLILTKRPEIANKFYLYLLQKYWKVELPNLILGTSIENQQRADERIPQILKVPAWKRVLSIEPLLEPISLAKWMHPEIEETAGMAAADPDIDWVIIGAESGANRRPCKIEWIESIVEQCNSADVPVFVKQIHDNKHYEKDIYNGKVIHDINQFPESIRYREYWKED
jgi:protein gp37